MSLAEKLDPKNGKIDSLTRFNELGLGIHNLHEFTGAAVYANAASVARGNSRFTASMVPLFPNVGLDISNWWLVREYLRIQEQVYTTTEVLDFLNYTFAGQYALHLSDKNPDNKDEAHFIAYTPDADKGARDIQIRTTLGKFLYKYFPLYTAAQVQAIEQAHTAEVKGEYFIATTAEEILWVYQNMPGDSGCMRFSSDRFGLMPDQHPVQAYATGLGLGVAYTKDAEGKPRSRSIVYNNPNDESDKRMIRMYGSPILQKILQSQGYQYKSLEGVLLKKIPVRANNASGNRDYANKPLKDAYLMPYLDGLRGDQNQREGSNVVIEGDWLKIIGQDEGDRIRELDQDCAFEKTAGGRMILKELPPAEFVSGLTGKTWNRYKIAIGHVFDDDFNVLQAEHNEISYDIYTIGNLSTYVGDEIRTAKAKKGTALFTYNTQLWIDNDNNRAKLGFKKFSTKLYPGDNQWTRNGLVSLSGEVIKEEDGVSVILKNGEQGRIHKLEIPAFKEKGFVLLHAKSFRYERNGVMAEIGHADLIRTISKTWILKGHPGDYVELTLEPGMWINRNKARETWFAEHYFWLRKDDTRLGIQLVKPEDVEDRLEHNSYVDQWKVRLVRETAAIAYTRAVTTLWRVYQDNGIVMYGVAEDGIKVIPSYRDVKPEELFAGLEALEVLKLRTEADLTNQQKAFMLFTEHLKTVILDKLVEEHNKELEDQRLRAIAATEQAQEQGILAAMPYPAPVPSPQSVAEIMSSQVDLRPSDFFRAIIESTENGQVINRLNRAFTSAASSHVNDMHVADMHNFTQAGVPHEQVRNIPEVLAPYEPQPITIPITLDEEVRNDQ